ncbi:NAD(P)-dependent alcohol dehydrogenase [Collinsella sp. zg1085]|uniref:NAD(P)-dependent alcohol dehydrogenase n=1 Tax=Collinsella sp. zg1085 TaxID=2844380 RepID=UPI001C0BFABE|nr:NAD(P)-dependent alcohol dehydrogenase [Collinsella sp. zg1085]QWT18083.1 NAD(P)-dependent alcohol dehydrogenase [Collinsella sp. zg1085]
MKNSKGVLVKPLQFDIYEAPMPEPGPKEILLKVEYVGLCGSDIHGFEFGPYIPPKDPNQEIGLGHEVAGEVAAIGQDVTRFKVGDKVIIEPGVPDATSAYSLSGHYNVCPTVDFMATQPNYRGALCQYMVHPEAWTYHLPKNMSTMEGALVEPAAVGMHAAMLGDVKLGSHVVILGGGTIGLMTLQACRSLGATDITVVDVLDSKLEFAKKLGAKEIINGKNLDVVEYLRSEEKFGDHGVEVVFECGGVPFLVDQAVKLVARGGKIVLVGTQSKPVPIDFLKINREVSIQTSFRYCNDFPRTIEAIASGAFNVRDMVTQVYDYQDIQTAFEDCIDPEKKASIVKAVVKVAGSPGCEDEV